MRLHHGRFTSISLILLSLLAAFLTLPASAADTVNAYGVASSHPYAVDRFEYNGKTMIEVIVPGRPPEFYRAAQAVIPESSASYKTLSDIPAYYWSYGCSATAAAMLFGHYDNTVYPNVYTGPTNGGVMPMTNRVWGKTVWPGVTTGECPLSATRQGTDGRTLKGHVDDYWVGYGSTAQDPFIGKWAEHAQGECTSDFMGTNQSSKSNVDGATSFWFAEDGSKAYDYSGSEPARRDGCHGMKLFFESRGYTVTSNYNQLIAGFNGNTQGFTFADYMAEIDAGRPVIIHVNGHSMLGYGYDGSRKTVYLRNTWDYGEFGADMTWGGTYSGLQHYGVSVFVPAPPPRVPGNLKWSYNTGYDYIHSSSPAVGADGTIYVGSSSGLHAIKSDGTPKWFYRPEYGIDSSPAIAADGTVFVSGHGKLYAINPDGTLKWSCATGYSTDSSPAIGADGTVFVGSWDGKLYAIYPYGALRWSYATGDAIYSSPAIAADGTIYVGSWDGKFYAINPNGTLKWSYTTGNAIGSSPAIAADGTVFVSSGDGKLYAINPDGTLKWVYTAGGGIGSSPTIGADGTVYVGSYNGNLHAIKPNGTAKWSYGTNVWISPCPAIGADGTVYVRSYDAKLQAISPNGNGTLKWSYGTYGDMSGSSPTIGADGTVYVGSDYKLYAIFSSSSGPANSPWPMFHSNPAHTGKVLANPSFYASFSSDGLYKYDGSWSLLTKAEPQNMFTTGSTLYPFFASDGFYKHNGAWARISSTPPEMVVSSLTVFYAYFPNDGLYKYDGTWTRLTKTRPENMVASGAGVLYASFASDGLYKYDGSWTLLTVPRPQSIIGSSSGFYAYFASDGLYKYDGHTWTMISSGHPASMAASGSVLYSFFASDGLYKHDGSTWTLLTSAQPESMVAFPAGLYVYFASDGLYKYDGTWTKLSSSRPESMSVSGSTLFPYFASDGLYQYDGGWTLLTRSQPHAIMPVNLE